MAKKESALARYAEMVRTVFSKRGMTALWEGELHNEGNKMRARQAKQREEEARKKAEKDAAKKGGKAIEKFARTEGIELGIGSALTEEEKKKIRNKGVR